MALSSDQIRSLNQFLLDSERALTVFLDEADGKLVYFNLNSPVFQNFLRQAFFAGIKHGLDTAADINHLDIPDYPELREEEGTTHDRIQLEPEPDEPDDHPDAE
jgi:hypothetical protein